MTFRATLTETIEDEVEALYQHIRLQPARRKELERALRHQLELMIQDTEQQLTQLTTTRQRLVHQRDKLLQAHYEDAIPLEVLKAEQQRITRSLATTDRHIHALEQDLRDREDLIVQALDLAEHTAATYHQAPDHIRRMLNQLLFERIHLVPDRDSGQVTTTATCMPPFDSILGQYTNPTDSKATNSPEGTQDIRGVGNTRSTEDAARPKTPEAPGDRARSGDKAGGDDRTGGDDEVGSGDEVGNPSPATAAHARLHGSEPTETTQNQPFFNQKPTPETSHDVGLSAMQLVGVAGFEPTTSSSRTKRATKLRHTPCAAEPL